MLEILFTQDSEVEDLFCDAPSGFELSLLVNLFGLDLEPIQDNFQHDFALIID